MEHSGMSFKNMLVDTFFHNYSRQNSYHVLRRLLPQPPNTGHNLRQRTHSLSEKNWAMHRMRNVSICSNKDNYKAESI